MSDQDPERQPSDVGGSATSPLLALTSLAALLLIGVVTFAGLWVSARSDVDSAHAELAAVTEELELWRAEEQARQAEVEARPDVGNAAERWLGDADAAVHSDEQSATVRISSHDADVRAGLDGLLEELGFSTAVRERMARTRALDGTQQAAGSNVNVTWTYHPDTGLQMVFEVER